MENIIVIKKVVINYGLPGCEVLNLDSDESRLFVKNSCRRKILDFLYDLFGKTRDIVNLTYTSREATIEEIANVKFAAI